MDNNSISHQLHDLLMQQDVGFQFTLYSLKKMVADAGFSFTKGAISGFINRAIRYKVVDYFGRTMHPEANRSVYLYEIVDHEPWNFKAPGTGSAKGRVVNRNPNALGTAVKTVAAASTKPMLQPELKLSDKLYNMALEAMELETKSLKDYSTEELLNEIKNRIK